MEKKDGWMAYRPEIKVFDCTIRDGGLINDHQFSDAFVRGVFDTCVAAGVDYCELGYKNARRLFNDGDFGPWKFCDEEDMRRIVGDEPPPITLSAMADAERCDYKTDILPADESVLGCIRVASYVHQVPIALEMIEDAHGKGYETAFNLMAASTVNETELREAIRLMSKSPVDFIYLVDSFGYFYGEQIRDLVKLYSDLIGDSGKEIGIHAHNNMQMAYSNTVEALVGGANILDATINGIGRGAGNCALELLLAFLHNPKFRLRPVIKCIQEHLLPLKDSMEWGYRLPYMFTGHLNQHPRAAIKMRAGDAPDDYVDFYDQVIDA
jgi:4-hydroxy 2-oxovalerate aldolase